ncbi:MAG TPA: NADH-quinone oxidoreductase subunit C [archaeon]|nr:NADH-quinone oxidoreductase subunit C [archaeon]
MKSLKEMKTRGARLITMSCDGASVFYHFFYQGQHQTMAFPARNLKSLTPLYPGAELYERELMEKYGVKFAGHPKPLKLFT